MTNVLVARQAPDVSSDDQGLESADAANSAGRSGFFFARWRRFASGPGKARQRLVRFCRYGMVSIATVTLNQILLLSMAAAFAHLSLVVVAVIATSLVTVPSFELHRRWVWKKTGRSYFIKEVLPYVTLAFIGLLLSTGCVALSVALSHSMVHDRVAHALVGDAAYLSGYVVLWVVRFFILEKYVFVRREGDPR
jgi:putative flippase GtrA